MDKQIDGECCGLYGLAVIAEITGESLDQLFFRERSISRILSARSTGRLPQRLSIKKSRVTPYRSTSAAAIVSVSGLCPFSKRDQ